MDHSQEEFIGVDVGSARVGVARGSSAARIAQPLKTLPAGNAIADVAAIAAENKAGGVVVGFPRGLDGQETAQTKVVKEWVKRAQAEINLPFYWQDETLSSKIAESQPPAGAGSDAVAASVILQDFLSAPKEERVRC